MGRHRLLTSSVIGAIDQALLSALNFGLGITFIRASDKTEFAVYTLAATALLLVHSTQNALVNAPATTLVSAAQSKNVRLDALAAARQIQAWILLATMALGLIGAILSWVAELRDWTPLILSASVAGVGILSREYSRSMHYLEGNPLQALKSDAVYVFLAIAGGSILIATERVSASSVFVVIGLAAVIAQQLDRTHRLLPLLRSWRFGSSSKAALLDVWHCAKWALPSVVNTWLYANAYLYIVGIWMSQAAVAELSAARLLGVPLSLAMAGWTSAFRPRAGQWLAAGRADRVHALAVRSALGFMALGVVYGGLLWLALPLIERHLLGAKYHESIVLIWPWLLLVTANNFRGVGQVSMLTCKTSFRTLFGYGCIALLVALPTVAVASALGSQIGVLAALTIAELVLAGLIWQYGWPTVRALNMTSGNP